MYDGHVRISFFATHHTPHTNDYLYRGQVIIGETRVMVGDEFSDSFEAMADVQEKFTTALTQLLAPWSAEDYEVDK